MNGIVEEFLMFNQDGKKKSARKLKRMIEKRKVEKSLYGPEWFPGVSNKKSRVERHESQLGRLMHPPASRGGSREARPVLVPGSISDPRRLKEALRVQALARSGPLLQDSVGDMVHLDSGSIQMGRHALVVPVWTASPTAAERVILDGAASLGEHGRVRLGVAGWAKVSEVAGKRNVETIKGR